MRRIAREREIHNRPHEQQRAGAAEHRLPTVARGYDWSDEDGERLSHRAQAVNAQGCALPSCRRPSRDECGPDGKRRSGHADQKGRDEERLITCGERNQDRSERRKAKQRREDQPPAEPVGEHAHRQPRQRAEQHRHRHQQRSLRCRQCVETGKGGREPSDETPCGERQCEGDGRERQGTARGPARAGRWTRLPLAVSKRFAVHPVGHILTPESLRQAKPVCSKLALGAGGCCRV